MTRWAPIGLLLLVAAGLYASGVHRELSWEGLARNEAWLRGEIAARPWRVGAGFVGLYATAVALSFPGALLLTITGGLLFGTMLGAGLAVCGATCGAAAIFLAARTALAPTLAARAGPAVLRFKAGLARDAFSYILALRLIPVVPFWLVNLSCAILGVRIAPFLAATAIGIIPGSLVYASLGAGLGGLLSTGQRPDLGVILTAPVLLPLLGLALLALLPAAWRAWRGRDPV